MSDFCTSSQPDSSWFRILYFGVTKPTQKRRKLNSNTGNDIFTCLYWLKLPNTACAYLQIWTFTAKYITAKKRMGPWPASNITSGWCFNDMFFSLRRWYLEGCILHINCNWFNCIKRLILKGVLNRLFESAYLVSFFYEMIQHVYFLRNLHPFQPLSEHFCPIASPKPTHFSPQLHTLQPISEHSNAPMLD